MVGAQEHQDDFNYYAPTSHDRSRGKGADILGIIVEVGTPLPSLVLCKIVSPSHSNRICFFFDC